MRTNIPKLISSMPNRVPSWVGASASSSGAGPSLTEIAVNRIHFVQEDGLHEIGTAIAQFVRT